MEKKLDFYTERMEAVTRTRETKESRTNYNAKKPFNGEKQRKILMSCDKTLNRRKKDILQKETRQLLVIAT